MGVLPGSYWGVEGQVSPGALPRPPWLEPCNQKTDRDDISVESLPANVHAATTTDQHKQGLGYLQDELNRRIWPTTPKTKLP